MTSLYTDCMKHLVDLDEEALAAAQAALGTSTIKATVNQALALAADATDRDARIRESLDILASMPAFDRGNAWA